MSEDPTFTDPDKYRVLFENEHVRVLEYTDRPGERTSPHAHPDSVMYTLSSFRRRLYSADGETRDVDIAVGTTGWLPAQRHAGHNIGDSETHVIFVELKDRTQGRTTELGPTGPAVEQLVRAEIHVAPRRLKVHRYDRGKPDPRVPETLAEIEQDPTAVVCG